MDPILDKARAGQNALEQIANAIPGFQGYREKELRRDADRLQREYLASRLEEAYLLALVSALIAATHPSLFFGASDVPALRQSAQTTHAAIASHITAILDQHLNDPAPTPGDYEKLHELINDPATAGQPKAWEDAVWRLLDHIEAEFIWCSDHPTVKGCGVEKAANAQ